MPRSKLRSRRWRRLRIRLRRALIRIERKAPEWTEEATPWGASFLVHLIILILLAIFVFLGPNRPGDGPNPFLAEFGDQLVDDLTTVEEDNQAGDPFTKLADETPSLPAEIEEIEPDVINLPALSSRFGPELKQTPLEVTVERPDRFVPGISAAESRLGGEANIAPFSGRSALMKAELLRRGGGTVESEAAVEAGLEWVARHQGPAGNWTLDPRFHCTEGICPGGQVLLSDTAATGLALLPMLGAGHSHNQPGRYQASIDRGLIWLLGVQQPSGDLFVGGAGNARMYSHAIATMALCEAYGLSKDPKLREPAQRAINFIVLSQNQQDGGWRYQPGMAGDTSVFGWQMLCLRSASLSGLKVPTEVVKGCKTYLDGAAADRDGSTYAYRPGHKPSPVMTAEGLLCRQYLGWKRTTTALRKGAALVYKDLQNSGERNIYYWYYATQLLHNMGGEPWERWNAFIRDGLIANQVKGDGCDRGSWAPDSPQPDRWGVEAGRHYVTCLSLLTLEVYYRYLPLYQERDLNPLGDDSATVAE